MIGRLGQPEGSKRSTKMNLDGTIRVIDAITKLVGIIIWPAVLLFVVVRFGAPLREFIANMAEISLKGAGFEASAKRKQAEAVAALTAANISRPGEGNPVENATTSAREAAQVVADVVTPRVIRNARQARVLWVDDNPYNNIHERQSLEALGVTFVLAATTDEAIEKLKRQHFEAIISDMGRPPDPRAGYTLLDQLRASGDRTPFIIYAGSRSPEHQIEARKHDAIGCTNRPSELFEMVLSVVGRGRYA
jgi:CheY-like chemotaxis protein